MSDDGSPRQRQRELERAADELLRRTTPKAKKKRSPAKLRERASAALGIITAGKRVRVESSTTVHRRHKSFRKR